MMSHVRESGPLRSELEHDAEMHELIEFYLDELQRKVTLIEGYLGREDAQGVEMVAHQLKGSSVGYGYPLIGESAGDLESALRGGAHRDSVRELTDRLLELCARALMA